MAYWYLTVGVFQIQEHMWSVKFDFRHKGLDAVYFEIWKRVAKQKVST